MNLDNIKEFENEVEESKNTVEESKGKTSFIEIFRKNQVTIGLIVTVFSLIVLVLIYGIVRSNPVNKINMIKEEALQTVATINGTDNNWVNYTFNTIKKLKKIRDMGETKIDVTLKEELNRKNKFAVDANKEILDASSTAKKNLETCKSLKWDWKISCEDDVIINYIDSLDKIINKYYKNLAEKEYY